MCVGLNWASSIVLGRPGPAKVNGRLKSGYYQQKRPARFDSSGYSICGKRSVHESVFDSISPQLGPFSLSFQGRVRVFNDHPFYSAMEPFPGPSGPCILNHVYWTRAAIHGRGGRSSEFLVPGRLQEREISWKSLIADCSCLFVWFYWSDKRWEIYHGGCVGDLEFNGLGRFLTLMLCQGQFQIGSGSKSRFKDLRCQDFWIFYPASDNDVIREWSIIWSKGPGPDQFRDRFWPS